MAFVYNTAMLRSGFVFRRCYCRIAAPSEALYKEVCGKDIRFGKAQHIDWIREFNPDIPKLLASKRSISTNLESRKLKYDINWQLIESQLSDCNAVLTKLESTQIMDKFRACTMLLNNKKGNPSKKQRFEKQLESLKQQYQPYRYLLDRLSEPMLLEMSKIPNRLSAAVSEERKVINMTKGRKAMDDPLRSTNSIIGSDFGCFYLTNELVWAELDLIAKFDGFLASKQSVRMSLPSFLSSSYMDMCGLSEKDFYKIIRKQEDKVNVDNEGDFHEEQLHTDGDDEIQASEGHSTLYLVGTSPYIFYSFLSRHNVGTASVPFLMHACGRGYRRVADQASVLSGTRSALTSSTQCNQVAMFGAASDDAAADRLYVQYLDDLFGMLQSFGRPVRLVQCASSELYPHEANRIIFEMQSSNLHDTTWTPVSSISLCYDYMSRRTHLKQVSMGGKGNQDQRRIAVSYKQFASSFLHTIHGIAVDINALLFVLTEDNK